MGWRKSRRNDIFTEADWEELVAPTALEKTVQVVEIEVLEQLTPAEEEERKELELKVQKAFFESGVALQELRDRRLYRSTHSNFDDYCLDRFGQTRQRINYLIAGAKIYHTLVTFRCLVLPSNEFQVRPLRALPTSSQPLAWNEAVELYGGKVPPSRLVREVVERIKNGDKSNPFELGEVVSVMAKDNPQLRGRNGCWGIVIAVSSDSCDLQFWNGTEEGIKIEYLLELEYTEEDCEVIRQLNGRIQRLSTLENLEPTAKAFLGILGKIDRPYMTPLEEKLLAVLEDVCSRQP